MGIVVLGLGMYAASLTGWVLLYVYYGHPECPLQQTLISLTLLLSLALTAVSCSKIAPHGTPARVSRPRTAPRRPPGGPDPEGSGPASQQT